MKATVNAATFGRALAVVSGIAPTLRYEDVKAEVEGKTLLVGKKLRSEEPFAVVLLEATGNSLIIYGASHGGFVQVRVEVKAEITEEGTLVFSGHDRLAKIARTMGDTPMVLTDKGPTLKVTAGSSVFSFALHPAYPIEYDAMLCHELTDVTDITTEQLSYLLTARNAGKDTITLRMNGDLRAVAANGFTTCEVVVKPASKLVEASLMLPVRFLTHLTETAKAARTVMCGAHQHGAAFTFCDFDDPGIRQARIDILSVNTRVYPESNGAHEYNFEIDGVAAELVNTLSLVNTFGAETLTLANMDGAFGIASQSENAFWRTWKSDMDAAEIAVCISERVAAELRRLLIDTRAQVVKLKLSDDRVQAAWHSQDNNCAVTYTAATLELA